MFFKQQTIKKYLEKKHSLIVNHFYRVDKGLIDKDYVGDIEINCDCEISYFVDVDSTPGYDRFNMKQMLNVIQLDFSDLLKYVRKKKLDEIS